MNFFNILCLQTLFAKNVNDVGEVDLTFSFYFQMLSDKTKLKQTSGKVQAVNIIVCFTDTAVALE